MCWSHVLVNGPTSKRPASDHRRTGRGAGGGSCPPIRAVCRHEFGQRVDIIRAKHNICLNYTNLGSVTAVNGKNTNLGPVTAVNWTNSATPQNMDPGKFLLLPPPHWIWIPENLCYYPPPHWIHSGKTRSAPPPMDVGPYAYASDGGRCTVTSQ